MTSVGRLTPRFSPAATGYTEEHPTKGMIMTELAQCPVCGMTVDPQTAPSATYDAQTYYFCSDGCRDQFVADPASYVGNTGS